jgi:hypothetical protein
MADRDSRTPIVVRDGRRPFFSRISIWRTTMGKYFKGGKSTQGAEMPYTHGANAKGQKDAPKAIDPERVGSASSDAERAGKAAAKKLFG